MDSAHLVRHAIMLSPKTIKDLHGILHKALNQAAAIGYLRFNPADACNIPKAVRKELTPSDTEDIQKFLTEIRGNPSEILLSVTLLWDCVKVRYWPSVSTILTLNTVRFLSTASYSAFARIRAFTALCPPKTAKVGLSNLPQP